MHAQTRKRGAPLGADRHRRGRLPRRQLGRERAGVDRPRRRRERIRPHRLVRRAGPLRARGRRPGPARPLRLARRRARCPLAPQLPAGYEPGRRGTRLRRGGEGPSRGRGWSLAARTGPLRAELERLVADLGLAEVVVFHRAEWDELPALVASADVLLSLPSSDSHPGLAPGGDGRAACRRSAGSRPRSTSGSARATGPSSFPRRTRRRWQPRLLGLLRDPRASPCLRRAKCPLGRARRSAIPASPSRSSTGSWCRREGARTRDRRRRLRPRQLAPRGGADADGGEAGGRRGRTGPFARRSPPSRRLPGPRSSRA